MRDFLKALIVVSAAAAAGPALASDASDNIQPQMLVASQLAFAAQTTNRVPAPVAEPVARGADAATAAISQGFAPVDTTSNALHGAN